VQEIRRPSFLLPPSVHSSLPAPTITIIVDGEISNLALFTNTCSTPSGKVGAPDFLRALLRPGVRLPAAAPAVLCPPERNVMGVRVFLNRARANFRVRSTTSGPLLTQSVNRRPCDGGAILPHIHAWSDTRYNMAFNLRSTVHAAPPNCLNIRRPTDAGTAGAAGPTT
jgi:hypothetical protein